MNNIWTFKYEPKKFEDMILNDNIKPKLKKAIEEVPNIMLFGKPGVGKGTFANILLRETGFDNMWINASDETGIDTIRDKVRSFSTALGITPLKIVVLNEADSLSQGAQGAQKMLKQLIEDVHKICRFIFLTNNLNLMMEEIQSRCQVITVDNPPIKDIGLFCSKILKAEGVEYQNATLISIIKKCYPDIRKTIWALQENTIKGKLVGDLISTSEALFKEILAKMLVQDVESIRNLLRSNFVDYDQLYEYLYENLGEFSSPGGAILEIGDHARWSKDVANKEINFMHMVFKMIWGKVI